MCDFNTRCEFLDFNGIRVNGSVLTLFCLFQEYRVKGNAVALVEKLDSEFTKILQNADAHSTEYVQLLRDEIRVMKVIQKLSDYVEAKV